MVGLLVVGATAFVIMPKRPKYLAVLALTGLLALRLTGPQLMARYATTVAAEEERDGSAESRLDLWRDCMKLALEHPIFGVGPGNFPVVAGSLGWAEGKSAHSVWMQQAAETGFPGCWRLCCFSGFRREALADRSSPPTEENRPQIAVASGLIMSIVGFAVAGQFVSLGGLEIPYYSAMIGVVLLKQHAALKAATVPDKPPQQPRHAPVAPIPQRGFPRPMAIPPPGRY